MIKAKCLLSIFLCVGQPVLPINRFSKISFMTIKILLKNSSRKFSRLFIDLVNVGLYVVYSHVMKIILHEITFEFSQFIDSHVIL